MNTHKLLLLSFIRIHSESSQPVLNVHTGVLLAVEVDGVAKLALVPLKEKKKKNREQNRLI